MGPAIASSAIKPGVMEDPLAHLPCTTQMECRRGQLIYGSELPSNNIYLVMEGKVKVCRKSSPGRPVVIDIYQTDDFFGEAAFLGARPDSEYAAAMERTKLMSWGVGEIEEIAARRPKLAVALLQLLAKRTAEFGERIESFSLDNIARRLARSLIRFSERMGETIADDSVQMIPFTHELLSQYVGTSREIVTHYMNLFRRQGLLEYSRQGILRNRGAMQNWLLQEASAVDGRAAKVESRA